MNRIGSCLVLAGLLLVAAAGAALADDEYGRSYGVRIGYGSDPDQFVVGVQADMGQVYRNIRFVPSVDFGFGDHVNNIGFNGDFKAYLRLPRATAAFYFLAGPTIEIWNWDVAGIDNDTEIGVFLGGGVQMGLSDNGHYNLEARVGIGDVPEFRILLGVLFGGR